MCILGQSHLHMPIPSSQSELYAAIQIDYQKFRNELTDLSNDIVHQKNLPGHAKGSDMSVHNLVAYLLGWAELVLKWIRLRDAGQEVIFPEEGFKWNELGRLAKKFYADYEKIAFTQLCTHLDQRVEEIQQIIADKGNHALYELPWYEKYTLGRMIQLNTSSPYKNARTRIRKWKREQHG